jgi:5-methylthioadenosine/S-adenosylhomocysteine deaminase
VHTVLVDGRVLKLDHELVGLDLGRARDAVDSTVRYLRATLGEEAWQQGMNPDIQPGELFDNPYQYTEWDSKYAVWKRD